MIQRLFVLLALMYSARGYSQNHTQFWMRASIHHRFNKKVSGSFELHHRMQSIENTESPFRYTVTEAVRLWVNYKIAKNQSFNFSPYAFFSNAPVINKEMDALKSNNNEHRIQLQYESKLPFSKKWSWQNREGLEYRFFEHNRDLLRIRFREGINHNINKRTQFTLYDELFLNTMNVDGMHFFDQNRIGLILSYTINKYFKLDIGTQLIHVQPRNVTDIVTNYVFTWGIQYTI